MLSLLEQYDGAFGAVEGGQAAIALRIRRHGGVGKYVPVTLVVVSEQAGGKVVAAAVPLAELGIDLYLHRAAPVCPVVTAGARASESPRSDYSLYSSATASGQISYRGC